MTVIIGKQSNLSRMLHKKIEHCHLVSARAVCENAEILPSPKGKSLTIIFNNFQPATKLHLLGNASEYMTSAILTTARILDHYRSQRIHKIIYTSSSSVYGNNILCNENNELKPMNLHASLKISNEKLIEKYCAENSIDYTIARIFNMYGGEDRFSVISKIIKAYKENSELRVVNNGNAIRDFISINDVVAIYVKLLKMTNIQKLNIGTGSGSSIKGILDLLEHHGIHLRQQNIHQDELKISTADTTLLHSTIGHYDFEDVESYIREELNI